MGNAKSKSKLLDSPRTIIPPVNPAKRKDREKLPVMFVRRRVTYAIGDQFSEPVEAWVAEFVRADLIKKFIEKEYYGTLPFDPSLVPESDRGFYDDIEKSIRYTDKSGKEKIIDCMFLLKPVGNGVLKID